MKERKPRTQVEGIHNDCFISWNASIQPDIRDVLELNAYIWNPASRWHQQILSRKVKKKHKIKKRPKLFFVEMGMMADRAICWINIICNSNRSAAVELSDLPCHQTENKWNSCQQLLASWIRNLHFLLNQEIPITYNFEKCVFISYVYDWHPIICDWG